MNLLQSKSSPTCSSSIVEEDFLIRKILLTHDPDGRHLDSELLLCVIENIMCCATSSEVSDLNLDAINLYNIKAAGSGELAHTIYKISHEVHCRCLEDGDLHEKTMVLFDMLGHYRWDAKLVLVLVAFATSYGEFWLLMQLYPHNLLAASLALLKQLPGDLGMLKPRFKALRLLVKSMLDVTKCVIKFEGLPLQNELLDNKAIVATKSLIYIAIYWVFRGSLACSSQITALRSLKIEQIHSLCRYSNSTIIAAWELLSLANGISGICCDLRWQVDVCQQQIETGLHKKLSDLFKDTHSDNQEILHMLFALNDDLPLKNSFSQAKLGLSQLKNKIVILLISKPELLPLEAIVWLVQQTYDHPHHKNLEESYEIVWVPVPYSDKWSLEEERSFDFLSNSLPWLSVQQPQSISSGVVNFFKQQWNFKEVPLMIALDLQGRVTNLNALDMVLIWGLRAFPFSTSREKELWDEEHWSPQFMVDEIDPLLTMLVEEGKNLCVYGSDDLNWIREFNSKTKKMKSSGLQLEVIYVGRRNPGEQVRNMLAINGEEMGFLTFTKMQFFWIRLESMKKSMLRLGHSIDNHGILMEVSALLDMNENEQGWTLIGGGSAAEIVMLQGKRLMEWFDLFPIWGENIAKLGLVGAIRAAFEPPQYNGACDHYSVIPYDEELIKGSIVCKKCKRPVEKLVIYKCEVTK